ncbi:hypothetical protein BaRGS_00038799 [Batillaria attramentaria]|uniref:Uncharacterized protein n=1 Tax=Batillaria attramentaria TaxID=370345 RepID=A0ABD0J5Z3_9CAEN
MSVALPPRNQMRLFAGAGALRLDLSSATRLDGYRLLRADHVGRYAVISLPSVALKKGVEAPHKTKLARSGRSERGRAHRARCGCLEHPTVIPLFVGGPKVTRNSVTRVVPFNSTKRAAAPPLKFEEVVQYDQEGNLAVKLAWDIARP